jgi:lysophospholipase L1-like esterase
VRQTAFALLIGSFCVAPAAAQVSGTTFEDRDGDGIHDASEPALPGVQVEVFGTRDAGGSFDQLVTAGASGDFSAAPGNGCYLVLPADPPGWRLSDSPTDSFVTGTPGYTFPVGRARLSKLDLGIGNLKTGTFRYASMGDSIAANFNICSAPENFWYSRRVRERLLCTAPATAITLDENAVLGQDTDDLLIDDAAADNNNVFRQIERQPDFITLSIIGNDMKDVDPPAAPTPMQIERAITELIDSRQNLQEILSAFVSEIPGADVSLNTLYDNLAYNCYTGTSTAFHRQWFPVMNRVLRDLAWGQTRRLSINEVASDFAHEDQQSACFGFDMQICRDLFGLDRIHPNNNGYTIVREKVWEGAGGVNLGPKDALGRTALAADYGFLRRVRRLYPSTWEARSGAAVSTPTAAFSDADGGAAAAITLGSGNEEVRFGGFPDWWDEIQIVRVLAGVRYRTTGTVGDDVYRIEASVNDQFRAPAGHVYTPTSWNFFTPIVGGGGPNQPPLNADFPTIKVLVRPNLASYREVSAALTKNPTLGGGAGEYTWPAVSHADLTTTTLRVAAAPVAGTPGNDAYQVQLDAAWLDLYGYEKSRPAEVQALRLTRLADGTVEASFQPLAGAQRYNVYLGHLDTLRAGGLDHGAGAHCASPTSDAGGGRLKASVSAGQQPAQASYWLVTAHVDDVESPSATRTGGLELDRAQSTCH